MNAFLWLMAIQGLMGAFDTVYHHELTEKLTWKRSAAPELRIHAIRSLIYAGLFLGLGLLEFHGLWAWLIPVAFGVEIVLTLQDFVTEDRTRDLPASERVTHTLLAVNGGAFLALLAPRVMLWLRQPTALIAAGNGWLGWVLVLFGAGLLVWAWRDGARSMALRRAAPGRGLGFPRLPARSSILVTGGTGFIGSRLCAVLVEAGHDVTVLTRTLRKGRGLDPRVRIIDSLDRFESARRLDAIVNLAGEPIAASPWTAARRKQLVESRVGVTGQLAALIARLDHKPEVLVSGSAVGFYGIDDTRVFIEGDVGSRCFSRDLCVAWEDAARVIERQGVRVCRLRIGLVLGAAGGMLGQLLLPFQFGLGGPIGNGRQILSWIYRDDVVGLILHAIGAPGLSGPLNATAPRPVSSREFARALGASLHRPARLPLPAWPLRLLLGQLAEELLLGGQHVEPARALASGYRFQYPDLRNALNEIVGQTATVQSTVAATSSSPASRIQVRSRKET